MSPNIGTVNRKRLFPVKLLHLIAQKLAANGMPSAMAIVYAI
jgi:hypothetical protein